MKKLSILIVSIFFVLLAAGCAHKAVTPTNSAPTVESKANVKDKKSVMSLKDSIKAKNDRLDAEKAAREQAELEGKDPEGSDDIYRPENIDSEVQ